jgi:hypothetical protein
VGRQRADLFLISRYKILRKPANDCISHWRGQSLRHIKNQPVMLILLSIAILGFDRSNRIEDKGITVFYLSIEVYYHGADNNTDIASGMLNLSSLSELVQAFILPFNYRY